MIKENFATLFVGIAFLITGVVICFSNWQKKSKGYIPLLIGLFLIYITTLGPLSSTKNKISQLTEINNDRVASIILQPTRYVGRENLSLFHRDSIIVDRQRINLFCEALKRAAVVDEDFLKNPQSVCRVEIHMTDKRIVAFGVKKSAGATCIDVSSNGEYGWHYANLQANDFGVLLNQFADR